ncbi:MAG TPA: hypothetical protein VLH60_04960, partial [Sedimentisphaerales bacterium]|nr:hypothetical protein [Sedimentisphaerales bacterium]
SPALYNLAALGARQAEVFVADYGMPRDLPLTATAEADWQAVDEAMRDSRHGPDGWAVADGILELAAGLAGLLGGVCGAKVLRFVSEARVKSTALKEIVEGNELFKKRNPGVAPDFKEAHSSQSSQTRQLVTALK